MSKLISINKSIESREAKIVKLRLEIMALCIEKTEVAEKQSKERTDLRNKTLIKVEGIEVFHVLNETDIKEIWNVTGLEVRRPLVRVTNLPTAKCYVINKAKRVTIFLDVRPSGVFYCTKKTITKRIVKNSK